MAENKILPWAQTGTANVLSDADYASDVAAGGLYGDGVKTGQASSQQANKTWRQATAPASGLAQFLVDNLALDVTDADTPATFSTRIANAVLKLAQISPFNQSWATATGGYRKYAIVSDSSGNYWVSTADQNVTVPGASGANWQSLFNGYATQSWADGRYVASTVGSGNTGNVQQLTFNTSVKQMSAQTKDGVWHFIQPAGDYATNSALNTETTNRTNADTNLQNQINNRVQKTGDTISWLQVSGSTWTLGNSSVVYNSAVSRWTNSYVDNSGSATWDLNGGSPSSSSGNINWLRLNTDGSLLTGKGTVAFQSDLPLPIGMKMQVFTVSVPSSPDMAAGGVGYLVNLPSAFSSIKAVTANDTGGSIYTISCSAASNSQIRMWAQSPQNTYPIGTINVQFVVYGYY